MKTVINEKIVPGGGRWRRWGKWWCERRWNFWKISWLSVWDVPTPPEIPEFTSKSVIKHAEFLISQILSYQQASDADKKKYMDSPLIKRICELARVQKASIKKSSKLVVDRKQSQKPKFESAMITPLVWDGALRWLMRTPDGGLC